MICLQSAFYDSFFMHALEINISILFWQDNLDMQLA